MKLPGSRQINDAPQISAVFFFLLIILYNNWTIVYININYNTCNLFIFYLLVFFFFLFAFTGSWTKDQRRRAEGRQTKNDRHGSQENRRTLSSAVRTIGILFDERPQQTAGALLARRRYRQGVHDDNNNNKLLYFCRSCEQIKK